MNLSIVLRREIRGNSVTPSFARVYPRRCILTRQAKKEKTGRVTRREYVSKPYEILLFVYRRSTILEMMSVSTRWFVDRDRRMLHEVHNNILKALGKELGSLL